MQPGWYADPTGRADRRWWDGYRWREAVRDTAGEQSTDWSHDEPGSLREDRAATPEVVPLPTKQVHVPSGQAAREHSPTLPEQPGPAVDEPVERPTRRRAARAPAVGWVVLGDAAAITAVTAGALASHPRVGVPVAAAAAAHQIG